MVKLKVKVRQTALVGRINRKLIATGEQLRRDRENPGVWYVLCLARNAISRKGIDDLEEFGRELGALREFEELEA